MQSLADPCSATLLRPPPRRGDDLRPTERNLLIGGVAALHLVALWALLQVSAVQEAVRQVAPLVVDFIAIERPKPEPPPPPPVQVPRPLPRPAPIVAAPPTPRVQEPAPFVVPPPPPEPVPAPPPAPPAPVVVAAPPAPPAPPAPRIVPASSVAYLVQPPIEVPLASRRMGEEGTVLLRVRVGTDGLPKAVGVQRSSGHARLDEQAVWAMKRARFKPQTEDGVAIEWIVIAPLQYAIE